MDDLDHVELREELAAPARLAASRKPVGPAPTGKCLSCDEDVRAAERWCDSDCRHDWDRRQFANRQRSK